MADFTIDQYNRLNEAIAQGALKVKYADKEVTYRSLSEMLQLRNLMADDLGLNATGNSRRLFAKFSKGTE